MAVIKNIIESTFVAKGAGTAATATQNVTKAQTRLGQSSASAGRQFSAQASGLGGLVSVYAGAAANIFAITSAFQALSRAARNEEVIRGTETLARTIGESGNQIIAKTKEITKNQLSIVEAATQVNTALSAGFSADQIEGLTTVSLKASRALGRDLTDSFNRLVRGSAKLEPELIDELGIFTRIEPAVNKYAASLNRSASSLTTFERRQAFVNAVIDEGNAKFGIIDTSSKTSQQSIEQLSAKFQDLTQSVLGFVANILSPIADFLSQTGNLIIAFGAIGAIVFGKLKESIILGLGSGFDFVTKKLDNFTDKLQKAGPAAMAKFQASAKQALSKGEGGLTGTGAIQGTNAGLARSEGAEIRKLLATQDLSLRQAERGKAITARRIADLKSITNRTATQEAQLRGLISAQAAFNDRLEGTGKLGQGAAKGVARLSGAFNVLKGVVAGAIGFFTKFVFVIGIAQTIFSLFGIDLIGTVTEYFAKLNAQARKNREEIEALSTSILNSSGTAVQYAKALGLTEEQIADVRKEQADLLQGVQAGSVNAQIAAEETSFWTRSLLLFSKAQTMQAASLDVTGKSLERTTKLFNDNDTGVKSLDAAIKKLTDKTGELTKEEKFRLLVLQETKQAIDSVGKENVGLLRGIVATGVSYDSAAKAVKQLTDNNGEAVEEYKNLLDLLTKNVGGQKSFIAGAEAQGAAILATTGALQNFNEQLRQGVNAEKLSQALVRAKRELERFSDALDFDDISTEQEEALEKLEKRIQSLSNTLANVQGLEKINKDLQATFGGAIKSVDSLLPSGSISGAGQIAVTPEAVKANQMKFLDDTIAAAGNISNKQREAVRLQELLTQAQKEGNESEVESLQTKIKALGITSADVQRAINATTAEKAKVGLVIEAAEESARLLKTQEKSLNTLQQQLEVLKAQADVDILQKELDLLKAKQANAREVQKATNEANAAERAAAATARKGLEQEVELRIKALETSKQSAQVEAARAEAAQRAANAATRRADLQRVNAAEGQQNELGLLGNLATARQIREADVNVAREKFNAEMARLNREESLIRAKLKSDLAALDRQEAILREQEELNEVKKTNAALEVLDQFNALDEKKAIEDKARSDREAQIVKERALVLEQEKVADLQAINSFKDREYQLDLIDKKVSLLEMQAQVDNKYITAMAKILEQQARIVELQTGKKDPQLEEVKKTARELANSTIKTLQNNVASLRTNIEAQRTASTNILIEELKKNGRLATFKLDVLNAEENKLEDIKKQVDRKYEAESAKILETYNQTIDKIVAEGEANSAALADIEKQKKTAKSSAQEKLTALETERDKQNEIIALAERKYQLEKDGLLKLLQAAAGIIDGALNKGVDDLFEAIKNGTLTMQNFKQGLSNMLKDIVTDLAKESFKQVVVAPITDFLKEGLQSLLPGQKQQQQQQKQNFNQLASQIKANGAQQANITGDALKAQTDLLTKTFGQVTNVQIVGQTGPVLVTTSGQGLTGLAGKAGGGLGGLGKGPNFDGTTSDSQFGFADLEDLEDGFNMSGFSGSLEDYASSVGYDMNGISDASQMVGMEFSALGTESFSLGNSFMNLGNIAQMAGAGLGALLGNAIGGPAGSAIGGIVGAIAPMLIKSFFFSNGGLVNGYGAVGRMAGGGAVHRFAGGGLQRDSVPALLEPGEFVMRKSAVDSMGLPAMERMNSTGKSGMPPVKIQIENSGQEKDAEQGETMMDGEAMVVKMILKDLKSNGPIRKSIRANGR